MWTAAFIQNDGVLSQIWWKSMNCDMRLIKFNENYCFGVKLAWNIQKESHKKAPVDR